MVIFIDELRRDGIVRSACPVKFHLGRVLGQRIPCLNHKPVDYTVKKQTVVIVLGHQLAEIVPVLGGLGIEFHLYGSLGGLNVELRLKLEHQSSAVNLLFHIIFFNISAGSAYE